METPGGNRIQTAAKLLRGLASLCRRSFRATFAEICVFSLETLHPPGAVNQLLLAGEKGMAVRANFNVQYGVLVSRARLESVSTRADDLDLVIVRVNISFHGTPCRLLRKKPL